MGKAKRFSGVDEADMAYIEGKLSRSESNCVPINNYAMQLKALAFKLDIKCKNQKQKEFLNQLKNKNNKICFGVGSPGTGKSFISLLQALKELKDGNFETITIIAPTAQAGGADLSVGFLKGDFEQKVDPFCEADKETINKILKLSGNIGYKEITNLLMNNGMIKHEYVNFLLGKTIDNSIILCNEAQQYTSSNMRLILTRLGENSKIVITGDYEQVNRKSIVNGKEECGLTHAMAVLKDLDEVSITEFDNNDIVRNKLITKILERW